MKLSPWQIQNALHNLRQTIRNLHNIDPHISEDLQLFLDSVEGESDALEVLDALVDKAQEAERLAHMARQEAAAIGARAGRFEKREDWLRSQILMFLQELEQKKIERATYTVNTQKNPTSVHIDATKVTDERYWHTERVLDRAQVRKDVLDGAEVDGAEKGLPSYGIRIRI